jgi:thymidylate synthase
MNKLDQQYTDLLKTILEHGVDKKDRTGTGTKSIFGYTIRHNMKDGFPLLTTKKMPFKTIVTELLWFLRGDTNIKYLVDNNCHIWDGDAFKNFMTKSEGDPDIIWSQEQFINKIKTDDEFAKQWGDLGPIYGKQWRSWVNYQPQDYTMKSGLNAVRTVKGETDQITNLINDLKTNPDSRRLMVNAWNVGELDQMVLPPCHYGFQVYTRELKPRQRTEVAQRMGITLSEGSKSSKEWDKECDEKNVPKRAISLMWNQRSVDTFLGLPFNIASYGLLLEMLANEMNMVPDQLIGSLGDVHLYSNHIEQAKEQIGRKYTHEERTELLKQAMGKERYDKAVDELMPFGGGLSGYYDSYKIPYRTREPYPLPKVHVRDGMYCSSIQDVLLFDYQSHSAIKASLSN